MSNFKDFVTSSVLTRLLANLFVFMVLTAAVAILSYQVLTNQAISPICYSAVSAGLTYSALLIGVHTGAQLPGVVITQPQPIAETIEERRT